MREQKKKEKAREKKKKRSNVAFQEKLEQVQRSDGRKRTSRFVSVKKKTRACAR